MVTLHDIKNTKFDNIGADEVYVMKYNATVIKSNAAFSLFYQMLKQLANRLGH